jgi:general secretion pathway protein F
LLKNGLPLLSALNLSKEVVSNRKLSGLLEEAAEDLKHGRGLAEPFVRREILPQMALQMIRVGEESGSMDSMLAKVADIYDKETEASVKRLLTLLEPILIIGLGVIVAGIIMSIIVPILSANELVM